MKNGEISSPNPQSVEWHVSGMTCSNCALGVTKFLEKNGARSVHVSFADGAVNFVPPPNADLDRFAEGIKHLGYTVDDTPTDAAGTDWLSIDKKFYFALAWTLPLFLHMFFPHDAWINDPWVQFMLCLPVFTLGTFHFGKSAWHSLRSGVPNMDVLILIGSTAAFVYSFWGMIQELGHNYLFFETAATIITLVLLGNLLEHRSVKQTTTALKELQELQPEEARLVIKNEATGEETVEVIKTQDIQPGNLIQVNTGDKIPVDGEVVRGTGTANESMITGESLPVEKSIGDRIIGGTILESGGLRLRAVEVGGQTVLSRIISLVKNAQTEKPNLQKLADKVSGIFVPVVLAIAAVTFVISFFGFHLSGQQAMLNSIAVLVVACPCAMGLATPTAVMVGLGRAAKNGILFKGSITLESFARIRQVVFDKTGTLTNGNFTISRIDAINESPELCRSILRSLELHSTHPLALSMQAALKDAPLFPLENIRETKGIGLTGNDLDGNRYEAGSYSIAKNLTSDSSHNVYLLKNGQLIATVDLEDDIKPEAEAVIAHLKKQGIKTILLSGDRLEKCQQVAEKLGIDEVYAQRLPEEKLNLIETFNKQAPTAMVGDGINDAPALAKATIGISLSNASQIAIQSAQVILLNGDLNHLVKAFQTSKHTFLTIKQNLFWAFFYNTLAIPVAAIGLLNPMIAALSMAFSDVIVIGNSIRLKTKKIF